MRVTIKLDDFNRAPDTAYAVLWPDRESFVAEHEIFPDEPDAPRRHAQDEVHERVPAPLAT